MRLERHIFGSYSGYGTLGRSPGISPDDCRLLESAAFSFGQPNDPGFLRSLRKNAACFTRVLPASRRVLTRLLEGNRDDQGRPTVILASVVLQQQDWDMSLLGDLSALLDCPALWQWDGQQQLPVVEMELTPRLDVPRRSVPRVLALLAEVERATAGRRAVVVSADEFSLADICAIEMLVPPVARRQFCSSHRSLSAQLPVTLNCLAPEAAGAGSAMFRYVAGQSAHTPYTLALEQSELADGRIPLALVTDHRPFGVADAGTPTALRAARPGPSVAGAPRCQQGRPVFARTGSPWALVLVVAIGVTAAIGAFFVGAQRQRSSAGRQVTELQARLQDRLKDAQEQHAAALQSQQAVAASTLTNATVAAGTRAAADTQAQLLKVVAEILGQPPGALEDMLRAAKARMDPAAPDDALLAERNRLRAFYDSELQRQREWSHRVTEVAEKFLRQLRPAMLASSRPVLEQFKRDLDLFRSDWPLTSADDRKWVEEAGRILPRIEELLKFEPQISLALLYLDEADRDLRSRGMGLGLRLIGEIEQRLADAQNMANGLPDNLPLNRLELAGFKKSVADRSGNLHKMADGFRAKILEEAKKREDEKRKKANGG